MWHNGSKAVTLVSLLVIIGASFIFYGVGPRTTAAWGIGFLYAGFVLVLGMLLVNPSQLVKVVPPAPISCRTECEMFPKDFHNNLSIHQLAAVAVVLCVVIGVIGIEFTVRKVGGMWGNPWFIALHLTFAFSMATVLGGIVAKFRGTTYPDWHRKLVRIFSCLYHATLVTGTMLISRLPYS